MPVIYLEYFEKYLDILIVIGVPKKINRSEWAAHSFIVMNKDGRVRFTYNSRRLNKQVKRTPYLLSHIKDMLNKLSNFTYAKTLDFIMGYYNSFLTDATKNICTITAPFWKY